MIRPLVVMFALLAFGAPAQAADADVDQVVSEMREALHPAYSSTRRIEVVIRSPDGTNVEWSGRQARKHLDDGTHAMVTVLIAPPSVRGFALLALQQDDQAPEQWMYLPPVRRVRKIIHTGRDQHFLGTDFTIADLGFPDIAGRTFQSAGKGEIDGEGVTKVRETPGEGSPYSSIVTWISEKTHMPLRREFHDHGGELWRTQDLTNVTQIEGVATILGVRMRDEQHGGVSELRVSDVSYGTKVADELFEPGNLPEVAAQVFW